MYFLRIPLTKVWRTEGFHHITGLIIQLTEIIRMRLDLHTDTLTLDQRKQFLHGSKPHSIADLLLVRITRKLCIDNLHSHISGDLDHPFPVCNCKLSLFLRRTRPAIHHDKGQSLGELKKRDQIRNEYYEKFTGIRRDDPHYYDMVINVSKTGAAGAASLILDYIRNKEEEKGGNAS